VEYGLTDKLISLSEKSKGLIRNWRKQLSLPRLGLLILLTHFLLGIIYSVIVPIWEAYDETGHYPYVRYLATYHTLPPIGGQISQWLDESHQPPLYYFLGALVTFWIDTSDNLEPEINIHAWDGTGRCGYNIAFHPREEGFPYRGTVLAIHLIRLISVLIGTLTVWLTYLLSKEVFPEREEIALGAMSIVSFCPLFIFMGSVVNNDILVALLASLVLLFLLRTLSRGRPDYRNMIPLGISVGLALLTKNSALALIPLVLIGLTLPLVTRRWRVLTTLLGGLVISLAAALVCGWWYLRNYFLYGTPLPDRAQNNPITTTFAPFVTSVKQSITPAWFGTLFRNTFRSFWGYFGWGNVHITDRWVYHALGVLTFLCLIGLIFFFRSKEFPMTTKLSIALLLLCLIFFTILPLYRAIFFQDPYLLPGRYLLPAASVIGILFSTGLSSLLPRGRVAHMPYVLGGSLFLLALATPFRYIAPAYAYPAILSPAELNVENPLHINFGNQIELLGYKMERDRLLPGQELRITLCWQALTEMENNYTIGIHILGRTLQSWGQLDTHPGPGTYPTSFWRLGEIICDTYRVPLSPKTLVPSIGRISVGVQLYPQGEILSAFDESNNPITPIFGRFKLASRFPVEYEIPNRTAFSLGDKIILTGYDIPSLRVSPGDIFRLDLFWQAKQVVEKDHTVFLHLLDSDGNLVSQWDEQPWKGDYPTSLWDAGETVRDPRYLPIPENLAMGRYRLYVGMYLLETLERLPVIDQGGNRLLNDAIPLVEITVEGKP